MERKELETQVINMVATSYKHALNLKETAIRHSKNVLKRSYEDCNYIVCHIGGGISISAHCGGRMIDGYDIVGGEGPMAPTRCGSVSVSDLLEYMEKNQMSPSDMKKLCTRSGGFVSHVGISDAVELTERAGKGDQYAGMLWNTMIYQIEKGIGAMAAGAIRVLNGEESLREYTGKPVWSGFKWDS